MTRLPRRAPWVTGASAAVLVMGFMVVPWPINWLAVPALIAWTLVLARLGGGKEWNARRPIVGLLWCSVLVLGGLMTVLLAMAS